MKLIDMISLVLEGSMRGRKRRFSRSQALLVVLALVIASISHDCSALLLQRGQTCRPAALSTAAPTD